LTVIRLIIYILFLQSLCNKNLIHVCLGLGGFASKLKPVIPLSVIKTNSDIGTLSVNVSPRKVLTPHQPMPAVAPKKPGRRGAKATVDVSPVPLSVAPKLKLPEDALEISPSTKEKVKFFKNCFILYF
jgi:hypothetical protein